MTPNPLTAPTLLAVYALLTTHPQQPKGRELAAVVLAVIPDPTETEPKETER